jgi:hypothetical protein
MKRHFGARMAEKAPTAAPRSAVRQSEGPPVADLQAAERPSAELPFTETSCPLPPYGRSNGEARRRDVFPPPPAAAPATHIPRAARRAVLERDGLCCSWVDAHGTRCEERAGLEYDHRHPRGKGSGSDPANLRLLCRAHNRRAAELETCARSAALAPRASATPSR